MFASHCRHNYYREFAYKLLDSEKNKDGSDLRRIKAPVQSDRALDRLVSSLISRSGLYISVYSFSGLTEKGTVQYDSAKINRIYLDFDCEENPQTAVDEALLTSRSLIRHGVFPHCYFSGVKGIAMYIEFQCVDIAPDNKKGVLGQFFDLVIETVRLDFAETLDTLDHQSRSDIARVSRLPNSRHSSGYYCIPVTFGDMRKGIEHIKKKAENSSGVDLDHIIEMNIMRNTKMPIIMLNLEKYVIAEQKADLELEQAREQMRTRYVSPVSPVSSDQHVFSESDIQSARDVPLSSLISSKGRIKCPIHHGDNPTSFYINHKKNYWYCHSCGKGGSAIDYVMLSQRLDFREAVSFLLSRG